MILCYLINFGMLINDYSPTELVVYEDVDTVFNVDSDSKHMQMCMCM